MKKNSYAYFVESPRTINDLMQPHPIEQEQVYEIVKTIKLSKIDYETSSQIWSQTDSSSKIMQIFAQRTRHGAASWFSSVVKRTACL